LTVSLLALEKTIDSLDEVMALHGSSLPGSPERRAFRDAAIQRYEYCLELSWKTAMKVMGSNTVAAKPAVREMARYGLVRDSNLWLAFVDARNETSHSYDENVADRVFKSASSFMPEGRLLLEKLRVSMK
jgi:nucleotidyltransferase substrate binding protein (TIGR01987 family)